MIQTQFDVKSFTAQLPQKRMASGALIFDEAGKILIVNPTYRDKWLIPGGMVEKDESPIAACQREIQEELGLKRHIQHLLNLDYAPQGEEGTEALHFVFDGGVIDSKDIAAITLCKEELSSYQFVSADNLDRFLPDGLCNRVKYALLAKQNGRMGYLEGGIPCI